MAATRTATVTWNGNLATGSGTVSAGSSELFTDLPVSWAARTEAPQGQTSPEELLAAAHASCFSMQLAGRARPRRHAAGSPPRLGDRHLRQGRGRLDGDDLAARRARRGARPR